MVTRVESGLLYSGNFEPQSLSGLVVSHGGGLVAGVGAAVETVAGTVTVPASTTWTVYANLTTGLLVAAATSAVPATNALPLWRGVSNSSTTTLQDIRSWASTMLQVSPAARGFDQYLRETLSLTHDWDCDESAGSSLDDAGSGTDTTLTFGANGTLGATGDVSYETDDAISFDGTAAGAQDTNIASPMSLAGGTFGIVTKTNTISGGVLWAALGDNLINGQFNFLMFGPWTANSVRFQIVSQSGTDNLQVIGQLIGLDLEDDAYHKFVCSQPQDGGGVDMYMDGQPMTLTTETYAGTLDEDSWLDDSPRTTVWTMGAASFGANNQLTGEVSRMWTSSDTISAAEASTLNDARTGLVV